MLRILVLTVAVLSLTACGKGAAGAGCDQNSDCQSNSCGDMVSCPNDAGIDTCNGLCN